jgi:hypothetical protein
MVAEDDQHIEETEADRRHHEQIHRGDGGGVVAQKGPPALARRSPASHLYFATVDWATSMPSLRSSP